MKVLVHIEFSPQWVLSKSRDGSLPVEQFCNELCKSTDISNQVVQYKSFSEARIAVEAASVEVVNGICGYILNTVMRVDDQMVKLQVNDANHPAGGILNNSDIDALTSFLNGGTSQPAATASAPAETASSDGPANSDAPVHGTAAPRAGSNALADIEALIGAEEFKAICRELATIAPQIHEMKAEKLVARRHYLFSISSGCGMTTYAKKLADLLKEQGLFFNGSNSTSVNEIVLEYPTGERERGELREKVAKLFSANGNTQRILVCDISGWIQHENDVLFREILSVLSSTEDILFLFRVPFLEQSALEMLEKSIGDLFFLRTVVVTPFSDMEFMEYARKALAEIKMTMADAAWHVFCTKLWEEKSDGRFYGMHTVDKILDEIVFVKLRSNAVSGTASTEITETDINMTLRAPIDSEMTGTQMLERLIGIGTVKKRVEEIVAQVEWQREMARNDREMAKPCLHMRFVGNPGTGKTTVARILGKIFRERGILRIGALHEVSRRDLCGQYIGETAPKTTEVCRSAYGSVLFIDEAYSLYTGERDSRDYGREAIDTLIAEMENHRDDMVVIMAGYPEDMDKLLEANAGLAGRMPFTIEFPNYTREELVNIFFLMVGKDLEYDDAFRKAVEDFFHSISDEQYNSRFFSNARLARNLLDRISSKAAMRRRLNHDTSMRLVAEDVQQAVSDDEFRTLAGRKSAPMGFRLDPTD